ncbi:DUF2304 domain-containing protein [Paenibacillus alvei]|uniref:DUF2304 domain-containing protein n=1 Tax=Paenibacillus alvei TaxID=44250 RepID=A0A383RIY5_PAEAL|nr:conserved membrane protein of unknown function [Paenibacillus alvei]
MISSSFQISLVAICLILLVLLIKNIITYKLELKYALLWFLIVFVNLLISLFPQIFIFITHYTSIETPSNLLFLLGITASLIINYSLTNSLSRNSKKIKELTQEIGLLKNDIKKILECESEVK